MAKVGIIGVGRVGSIISYDIARRSICDEIVLIDILENVVEGHADDIRHALARTTATNISVGRYEDLSDSDVIVVTAGKPRTKDTSSRLDLAKFNLKIIKEVSAKLKEIHYKGIVVTLTNPMDVMNYYVWKYTGLPRENVIGTGGLLDSTRFTCAIAESEGISPNKVEAYVLGEHGSGQVPIFSNVKVDGRSYTVRKKENILEMLKDVGKNLIEKKGGTEFGPAHTTADMVESILKNRNKVIPSSFVLDGEYGQKDVSVGVPVKLGIDGGKVVEWSLSEEEKSNFEETCEKLRKAIHELE